MKVRTVKHAALLAALLAASGTALASPGWGDGFTARARVISSTPIYDTINEPHRECWTETVGYETRSYRDGSGGGAILGAIAGGLLGSTVGKGDGRVAAAAVGAATGAVVGDRWNGGGTRYEETRPRQVERCRVRDDYRQVISGYDVRYRFQGRVYATQLPYDPGRWLTLNGNFDVIDDPRDGRRDDRYNRWDN
ncbi:glycine zipper 2TM domain-containing protein [Thiobacillus sedimenti]|uniref:Glycine zipper 2TM domain-containing protein n=1 Tax=Thiobacillus sedimenti TaxID=3110231 RepID=A0ABZ1CHG3_9PROT|nr:glycine zipper 2TM domain-containing protein [Thiobacillus sp. SCUT-2]WRS38821.1 glycine zipper 2TM domain-containing protein [Thiobacillus sp. SCUT-2]